MAVANACIFISKDPVLFQHSFQHCVSTTVPALCSSICVCVPEFVFQHLCSSICVSASVFQHLCSSICDCVSAFCVPAFVFQHLCSSICVPASVIVFQHLCTSICVSAFVFQHLCSSTCVLASMFQHLLCVFHNQPIAIYDNLDRSITNRLPSMTTLTVCVISAIAIFPTISPFGIDGNMSFIAPPLTSRAKG
jgi:hypothetical protein